MCDTCSVEFDKSGRNFSEFYISYYTHVASVLRL